jgi:hypothetical protein
MSSGTSRRCPNKAVISSTQNKNCVVLSFRRAFLDMDLSVASGFVESSARRSHQSRCARPAIYDSGGQVRRIYPRRIGQRKSAAKYKTSSLKSTFQGRWDVAKGHDAGYGKCPRRTSILALNLWRAPPKLPIGSILMSSACTIFHSIVGEGGLATRPTDMAAPFVGLRGEIAFLAWVALP